VDGVVIDVHAHAMLPGVEALVADDPRARQAREDAAALLGLVGPLDGH